MRFGVFGGTFDPIHNAHIAVAEAASRQYELDRVYLVVAASPPHKQGERTSAHIRYDMVRRACEDSERLVASDIELSRQGKSYTVDTLAELISKNPHDEWFLIVGADMLESFGTWREPERILQMARLVATGRMRIDLVAAARRLEREFGATVALLDMDELPLSSTGIRRAVASAQSIRGSVPEQVAMCIYEHGCYMDESYAAMRDGIRRDLSQARYMHSIGTAYTSVEMAAVFGVDGHKARVAGLLHDCAKLPAHGAQFELAREYGMDEALELPRGVLHAPLSAKRARSMYAVDDAEILSAIEFHTTGRANMSALEKVVLVADKAEPTRSYWGVEKLRRLAYSDLNAAVVCAMDRGISHARARGQSIFEGTLAARDYIIKEQSDRGERDGGE
ncbi:MAG: nicotinate-nucleotide adenylyltransferase [Clostridia bacterium]|nr:nicotinate-nucleotide adenylyltransferase [Clostridia bacterium]